MVYVVAFWNLRDKYNTYIAKGSALVTPKEETTAGLPISYTVAWDVVITFAVEVRF